MADICYSIHKNGTAISTSFYEELFFPPGDSSLPGSVWDLMEPKKDLTAKVPSLYQHNNVNWKE